MLYSSTLSPMSRTRPTSWRRLAPACIATFALLAVLAGCSASKPARGRGVIDSPITTKTNHLMCLQQEHLPVQVTSPISLQIGALPNGPTVVFQPTPGTAQGTQIKGYGPTQGAEVIGSAQLYPNGADDGELKKIETCLGKGVSG